MAGSEHKTVDLVALDKVVFVGHFETGPGGLQVFDDCFDFEQAFLPLSSGHPVVYAVHGHFLNGGKRLHFIRAASPTVHDLIQALMALEQSGERFHLIAAPGFDDALAHEALRVYCARNNPCLAWLDFPRAGDFLRSEVIPSEIVFGCAPNVMVEGCEVSASAHVLGLMLKNERLFGLNYPLHSSSLKGVQGVSEPAAELRGLNVLRGGASVSIDSLVRADPVNPRSACVARVLGQIAESVAVGTQWAFDQRAQPGLSGALGQCLETFMTRLLDKGLIWERSSFFDWHIVSVNERWLIFELSFCLDSSGARSHVLIGHWGPGYHAPYDVVILSEAERRRLGARVQYSASSA